MMPFLQTDPSFAPKRRPAIDQTELRLRLHFDPSTGVWTWLRPLSPKVAAGSQAGFLDPESGYVKIMVNYRAYYAHRLAFNYMLGRDPAPKVDHRNGVRSDNRWDNLREATTSQNAQNKTAARKNPLGLKGVRETPYGRFRAVIWHEGQQYRLGHFRSATEASDAYVEAASTLQGPFAVHRRGEA